MKTFTHLFIVSLLLSALALTSCDPAKEFEAELKTIDSCMAQLDSIEQVYKGINFDSLDIMVEHVLANEAKMKNYYNADTVDQELGMLMNNCKGIRKSMKNVKGKALAFNDEIFALRKQFTNLKTDILNGAIEKEKINEYLAEEKAALDKLNKQFFDFYTMQKMQSAVYYYAVPKVDVYVQKLNIPDEDTLQ
jgi:hypothetical protein